MKKKNKKLKNWVEVVLVITTLLAMLVIASECTNTYIFIISKIISIIVIIINSYLLRNYTDLFKD